MKPLQDCTLRDMKNECDRHLKDLDDAMFTKYHCKGCKFEQVCDTLDDALPRDLIFGGEEK